MIDDTTLLARDTMLVSYSLLECDRSDCGVWLTYLVSRWIVMTWLAGVVIEKCRAEQSL